MTTYSQDVRMAMLNIKERANRRCIAAAKEASKIALEAIFNERFWDDDTYNLRDSFGYIIYHKGVEVNRGFLEEQRAGEPIKPRGALAKHGALWGREQTEAFFASYEPRNVDIEIVFVAGMYYAVYLEWKQLLMGFLFGVEEAKAELINAIRTNKIAR